MSSAMDNSNLVRVEQKLSIQGPTPEFANVLSIQIISDAIGIGTLL